MAGRHLALQACVLCVRVANSHRSNCAFCYSSRKTKERCMRTRETKLSKNEKRSQKGRRWPLAFFGFREREGVRVRVRVEIKNPT